MNKKTTDDFVKWWLAYPRKVGKKAAFQKWLIAIKEISDERDASISDATDWLLERTQLFADSDKGRSGEFCPYPTTWLSQGRYDDDVDEWNDSQLSQKSRRSIDAISGWLEGKS